MFNPKIDFKPDVLHGGTMPFMQLLSLLFGCLFLLNCSHLKESEKHSSAKNYYEQAVKYKKRKNYLKAQDLLQDLKKNFPYSSYTQSASLLQADIHFDEGKYSLASDHYERFHKVYPKVRRSYVLYQLGLAYFYQMPSRPDKDLSMGDQALKNLTPLLKRKSPYQKKARKHVTKILNLQAEKAWLAASFYARKNWNKQAVKRLDLIVKQFPKSSFAPKALLLNYKISKKLKRNGKKYKKQLIKKYPRSKEAQIIKSHSRS